MNFDSQHRYPYCKSIMEHNTHHDYFLLCPQSYQQKVNRIKELKKYCNDGILLQVYVTISLVNSKITIKWILQWICSAFLRIRIQFKRIRRTSIIQT